MGIKIIKETNNFPDKFFYINLPGLEGVHSRVQIVVVSISWMSNQDPLTFSLSSF